MRGNPKSEYRNPKQYRMPKAEMTETRAVAVSVISALLDSDLFRISIFGFRIFEGFSLPHQTRFARG
jgi:hypothetical protein